MALKCFLPGVFQNVWPFDNHNYALHSVVSRTLGFDLQNQQVADCFLLCECVWCVFYFFGGEGLDLECAKMSSNSLTPSF